MENIVKYMEKLRDKMSNFDSKQSEWDRRIAEITETFNALKSRLIEIEKFFELLKKFLPL
jgi:hypothetical protein